MYKHGTSLLDISVINPPVQIGMSELDDVHMELKDQLLGMQIGTKVRGKELIDSAGSRPVAVCKACLMTHAGAQPPRTREDVHNQGAK